MTAGLFAAALPTPQPDDGRIYVYAQRVTAARSWLPITCDGVVVARLKQGIFFAINVPPGRHSVGTKTGVPTFVDVRSSEDTFVRLDWNYEVGRSPIPVLGAVRPEVARKEMKYLNYVTGNKVLSSSVPKTDPRPPVELRLKRRPDQ